MSDLPNTHPVVITWSGNAPQSVTDALSAFKVACSSWPKTPYDITGPTPTATDTSLACEIVTTTDAAQSLDHSVWQAFRDGIVAAVIGGIVLWLLWWFLATGIEFAVTLFRLRRGTR